MAKLDIGIFFFFQHVRTIMVTKYHLFFFTDFCPGQCEIPETGLSKDGQRTLTWVAGILLFLSMGIQMVQNLSEGMSCGGKSKTKESISMERLN